MDASILETLEDLKRYYQHGKPEEENPAQQGFNQPVQVK